MVVICSALEITQTSLGRSEEELVREQERTSVLTGISGAGKGCVSGALLLLLFGGEA